MRKTFTFLPVFSLPYTHYSLLARCQALLRRFVEHCSWEKAAPKFKDADRVPDSSTVRRWSRAWTSHSRPFFSPQDGCASGSLAGTLTRIRPMAKRGRYRWLTPVLEVLCPCVAEKKSFPHHPCLGTAGVVLLRWAPEAKKRCG